MKLLIINGEIINKTTNTNKYEGIAIPKISNTNEKIIGNKIIKLIK